MTTTLRTPAARLDERYGRAPRQRRRGRLSLVLVVAVLAIAAAVWGVWTGVGGATKALDLQTTGYAVHDSRSVSVGWLVTGESGTALVCAIEAEDKSSAVVGIKEVRVPVTGRSDRSGTTTLRTTRTADTGLIESCRPA